jgi:hypothetical protein
MASASKAKTGENMAKKIENISRNWLSNERKQAISKATKASIVANIRERRAEKRIEEKRKSAKISEENES